MHPTELPPEIVQRVMKRRGRLHAFESLDPARTALVVIDMQNGFCAPGSAAEIPVAREIVPNINRLARATRETGGLVAWVQMTIPSKADWPVFMDTLVSEEFGDHMLHDLVPGGEGQKLYAGMETDPGDLFVTKNRFSAFLPSACELPTLLRQRGIDSVVIVGTLTNVCSESSGRDAAMSDFRTILVSDGNACRSDDDHLASLKTFVTVFGDVRSTDEVIGLLRDARKPMREAAE
jgi:ureidoacrylate peracid hydrolase